MRHIFQKTILGILLVLLLVGMGWFGLGKAEGQGYQYTIKPEHPRLFLTPQRLQDIRNWINSSNPPSEWQEIKLRSDSSTAASIAQINAFIYQIEGNATAGRWAVDALLAQMQTWADGYQVWWDAGGKNGARVSYGGAGYAFPSPYVQMWIVYMWAPIYDWTFDLMIEEERNTIIGVMNRLIYGPVGRWSYGAGDYYPLDPAGPTILQPPTGSTDPPATVTQAPTTFVYRNFFVTSWAAEAMWSLASYPENPEAQRMVDTTLATYEYAIKNQYNQYAKGGGIWEGLAYGRLIFDAFSFVTLAFPGALGETFYSQFLNDNPWLTDRAYYEIYATYPWKVEGTSIWNQTRPAYRYVPGIWTVIEAPGVLQYRDLTLLWKLSRIVQSPAKEHAYWHMERLKLYQSEWNQYVQKLLFYEPNIITQAPSSIPLFYYSEGMGYVFARSDWSDDATWLSFSGGKAITYYGSGIELGRFDLHKYAHLTGDVFHFNQGMAGNHQLAVVNNCLLIGEISPNAGEDWRHAWDYGGQIGWWNTSIGEPEKGHGEFNALENTDEYTYIFSNLKKAYVSDKVEQFDRQIVFLRPDYIFVFDRVRTTQPNIRKRFNAVFRNEPTITGDITTATNPIYVVGDPSEAKLFVKTLLPEDYTITKVGPGWDGTGPDTSWGGVGSMWRIEVESQTGQVNKDGLFLHAFYPTLATTQTMPETARIDATTNNMVGAQMQDPQRGNAPNIVMFSKSYNPQLSEPITYTVSGTGTSKHLIVDLKPNTQFTITNTNLDTNQKVSEETKVSSSQGTLYFETTLGSNHQISIIPTGEPPVIRGDINGDGAVNVVDVQLAVNQFLGIIPQTDSADLNTDGQVNVIDVQQIVNIILGGG